MNKVKYVYGICEKERELEKKTLDTFFEKEMEWVRTIFSQY